MQITRKQVQEIIRASQRYLSERDKDPQVAAAPPGTASDGECKERYFSLIGDLPEGEQQDLLALMWLGRGDVATFEEGRRAAEEKWGQKEAAIFEVSESEALDMYLQEGLKAAG